VDIAEHSGKKAIAILEKCLYKLKKAVGEESSNSIQPTAVHEISVKIIKVVWKADSGRQNFEVR
jgi:hypothetical protein